jgi:peptidoglycan/LPS O-acetylase OafA/YrhL
VPFNTSNPTSGDLRGRILLYRPEIDGLRAIAIIMVIFGHLTWKPFQYGPLGVDVFFVISGFLITQILLKTKFTKSNIFAFYRRRFARLAPALFVMVVFVSILSFFGVLQIPYWAPFVALTYTMNLLGLFIESDNVASPLNPTWSLASEEQFYLIWPIVLFTLLTIFSKRLISYLCISLFSIIYLLQFFLSDNFNESFRLHGPIFRPAGLLLGCALALYGVTATKKGWLFFPLSIFTFLLGVRSSNGMFISASTTFLLLGLFSSARFSRFFCSILSSCGLPFIGRLSYSLYLWNLPIILCISKVIGVSLLSNVLSLLLTFVISFLSYRFIEIPFVRILTPKTIKNI